MRLCLVGTVPKTLLSNERVLPPFHELLYDLQQVGVQTEVDPGVGANVLEEKVNAVLPLPNKDEK